MENTLIEMNEYLTPLTLETLSNLPEEVKDELLETINSILFIKNLISPNRRYAKDMPKDSLGKIIVDLLNPHILEDMDYFRQPALHFMKHGCYTFLRPNSNPNSEYRRYWDEEIRRCREGYIRESDGEWVTGYLYWFLNYCPMMINKVVPGTKKAIRIESFPFFFEGIYWRFHYLHLARESGKHAIELAKRGAHPYFLKVFTPNGWKNWGDINIGDKLYGTDNNICTVIDIPYDKVSPYYKITLRDGREVYTTDDHLWNIIRKNNNIIVNTAWLLSNYRTKRKASRRTPSGIEYTCYIPKNNGVDIKERNTLVEPYTFGLLLGNGCFKHKCCYYTLIKEDFDIERLYIPYGITKWKDKYSYKIEIPNWREILSSYNLLNAKSKDKFIPDEFKYNSRDVRLRLLMGLLDTDGSIHGGVPILNSASKRLIDDALFIARSLGYNTKVTKSKSGYYNLGVYRLCLDSYELSIYGGEELFRLPRKKSKVHYNSNNALSRKLKTCIVNIEYIGEAPCKCVTVDSKDSCYLIGDFITTHNCAKSYSLSSIMSHNLILGESEEAKKRVITVLTAYLKEYLSDSKDGTLSKFKPSINFSFKHTPFPRLLLKNSPNEMAWLMGYKDEFGVESGSLNLVLAVSAKDDSEKLRGKRGWILFEEIGSFKGLLSLYDITRKSVEDGDYTFAIMYLVGCVCAGTKVWTLDGRNINIEDLELSDGIIGFTDSFTTNTIPNISLSRGITKEPIVNRINVAKKECVNITLSNKNNLRCSVDHPILILKLRMNHDGSIRYYYEVFKRAGDLKIGDRVIESRYVPIFGKDTLFDARLVGMLIGDGSYGLRLSPRYSSEDKELLDYIKDKYNWSLIRSCTTKKGNKYEEIRVKNICSYLREAGIYGLVKLDKRLPTNYLTLTREDSILLLSGLYDTDGSIWFNKDGYISLTLSNRAILELVKILWRKFGIVGTIIKTNPRILPNRKDRNPWFSLIISGRYNCLIASNILSLLVPHKRDKLNFIKDYYNNNPSNKEQLYPKDILVYKVTSIENIGLLDVYNLTAGLSHTYLANNIVTHNTAAEDESDFSSAKTLLYNPDGYNILAINNVYDRPKLGKPTFGFFFPSYINRAGCYNKDGVSDVIKALIEILLARYKAKYSADPRSVLRVIAEDPITPAEAIIKTKASYFPTVALTERLTLLDSDPNAFDDVYIGNFITVGGNIEFRISNDIPIRRYGVDNSTTGAIEIFEMPEKLKSGENFNMRYIIGHDPVDNDLAESSSLSSTFVFDLFTDRIVAEYTGRLPFADDNFEIVRLLCLFYNAKCMYESNKKGLYGYFSKMNCTHLLADTPEYLRDKLMIKYSAFGSNAHPYYERVYTPQGLKNWGDINIGDTLFSPDGTTTKVIDIPIDEELDIYRVTLRDGRTIEASSGHLWEVYKFTSKKKTLISTIDMLKSGILYKRPKGQECKFYIKRNLGVDFMEKSIPINPYLLGLMLGDGTMANKYTSCGNKLYFTSSYNDMMEYMEYLHMNYKQLDNRHWSIDFPNWGNVVKELGLAYTKSRTKFIPDLYKYNSREVRLEILRGLLDTDGTCPKIGSPIFTTISEKLAKDVLEIARSLGIIGNLRVSKNNYGKIFQVILYTEVPLFRLQRKLDRQVRNVNRVKSKYVGIVNIEYIGKSKAKCVTVDREDGLYLIGDFVTTHNCKGINASAAINNYANSLIRDWLLLPVPTIIKEDGLDKLVSIPRLYSIRNRALLEELISYTPELNVDRIRALGMVMLYRLEKIILYGENLNAKSLEEIGSSYLGNDPFFLNNYRLGIQ